MHTADWPVEGDVCVLMMIRRLAIATLSVLLAGAATSCRHVITATPSPSNPVVGVTELTITGKATAGGKLEDISISPDGLHHAFFFKANSTGLYKDGPFRLHELGTYHDVIREPATGNTTTVAYRGVGDFSVEVDHPEHTILGGDLVDFIVTFKSLSGFSGSVVPKVVDLNQATGAISEWNRVSASVLPNKPGTASLEIQTLISTPHGRYTIFLEGTNGSVTHKVPVTLTVAAPKPGSITAFFVPKHPTVGVEEVDIKGSATPGSNITDTSTFPDGSKHKFVSYVGGRGAYDDGPFLLQQLGTYHDSLHDDQTGAVATISYSGVGDFALAVKTLSQTVARDQATALTVTFMSVSGFAGVVVPKVDLLKAGGMVAHWYPDHVTVRKHRLVSARLSITASAKTPPGTYKLTVQGTSGSVTHIATSPITLVVK